MSETTGGTKHDQGKPPMHLIPWEAMEGVARVMAHGETKYGTHQWRGGFAWGRLAGACLRHLFAWLSGQDKDPESGESHIDHALCCLMFLTAHIKSGLGTDDRYKTSPSAPTPRLWGVFRRKEHMSAGDRRLVYMKTHTTQAAAEASRLKNTTFPDRWEVLPATPAGTPE